MGVSAGKPPPAPDPTKIIDLENKYNRTNSVNPFGTSMWSTDANGHETNTVTAAPRTQSAIDRAYSAAETPYQKEYVPQGMDQLTSAILGKVGNRYGLGGQGQPALNTNMKQQGQGAPPPNIQQPGQGDMNSQIFAAQQQGGQGSGLGGMAGMMGGPQGSGQANLSPIYAALNRMQQQPPNSGAMPPQQQTWGA